MTRKLLLSLLLMWTCHWAVAQTKASYVIEQTGGVSNLEAYHEALQDKDLDPYRLISRDRTIKFESGVVVRLFSAKHLEETYGRYRDHSFMNRTGDEPVYPWFWALSPQGTIIDKRIKAVTP